MSPKPRKARTVTAEKGAWLGWCLWRHWGCKLGSCCSTVTDCHPCTAAPQVDRGYSPSASPDTAPSAARNNSRQAGGSAGCVEYPAQHTQCFCATLVIRKDDTFLVESLVTVTQGVLYFFWAVLGIYKWSFSVKCQNELNLCNPRSSKGIQKINLGIFSTGLLLGSSKRDPETLVCSDCLGLTFLFWDRLLGTSV